MRIAGMWKNLRKWIQFKQLFVNCAKIHAIYVENSEKM